MMQSLSRSQARNRLRRSLVAFYLYDFFNDSFDMVSMCIAYALTFTFHIIALLLLGVDMLFTMLNWRAGIELTAALTRYYSWCMDEIEQRANSIATSVGKIAQETANVKRVAKAALDVDSPAVFSPFNYETIIQKIQLTRESRKAVGTEISAFLLFILQVVIFMA